MAKIFYGTNTLLGSTPKWQELSETSPGAVATSSPVVGWVVGTATPTKYKEMDAGIESTAPTGTTALPDTTIANGGGTNNCFRTTSALTGSFAATAWDFQFVVRAVTSGGDQDGAATFRVWRSTDATGAGATEITSALQTGATVTNLATTADQSSSATWSPGKVTLTNEYLFVEVAWKVTGAGGNSTRDVNFRWGDTGTRIVTPDFPGSTWSDEVLTDSPKLWLRLDEAAGVNASDSSGLLHHGSYKNAPTLGVTGAMAGDTGITLNGSTQYVEVPDHADLDLGDVFTIEAIVKRTGDFLNQTIVGKGSGAYQLRIEEDDNKLQLLKQDTAIISYGPAVPADGKWHHVVATKNGSTVTLYVDGVESHSGGGAQTCTNTATALRVGAKASGSEALTGSVDEVAVYSTALNSTRIQAHYKATGLATQSVNLTVATETDAAQAITKYKKKTLTASTTTDTAKSLSVAKRKSITQASESDSASTLNIDKSRSIAAATETDTAKTLSVTHIHFRTLTPATEAGSSQALIVHKKVSLGASSETDTAQSLSVTHIHYRTLSVATETDTGGSLVVQKVIKLSGATEVDTALDLSYAEDIKVNITASTETDNALSITARKQVALSPATEVDSALKLFQTDYASIQAATETDSVLPLFVRKIRSIASANETDTASPLSLTKTIHKSLTAATETDQSLSISVSSHVTISASSETDAAKSLSRSKLVALNPASESDSAKSLSITKTIFKTLGVASEADAAQGLFITHINFYTLGASLEVDQALPLQVTKTIFKSLTGANETDVSEGLTYHHGVYLTPAQEIDAPSALTVKKILSIQAALETDSSGNLKITHVHKRTITPATETDISHVLTVTKLSLPQTVSLSIEDLAYKVRSIDTGIIVDRFSQPKALGLSVENRVSIMAKEVPLIANLEKDKEITLSLVDQEVTVF